MGIATTVECQHDGQTTHLIIYIGLLSGSPIGNRSPSGVRCGVCAQIKNSMLWKPPAILQHDLHHANGATLLRPEPNSTTVAGNFHLNFIIAIFRTVHHKGSSRCGYQYHCTASADTNSP